MTAEVIEPVNGRLPATCCTDPTRCGSWGTSTGPCALYHVRGCPLRHRRVKMVEGREVVG
jgi:hypothetical protein